MSAVDALRCPVSNQPAADVSPLFGQAEYEAAGVTVSIFGRTITAISTVGHENELPRGLQETGSASPWQRLNANYKSPLAVIVARTRQAGQQLGSQANGRYSIFWPQGKKAE